MNLMRLTALLLIFLVGLNACSTRQCGICKNPPEESDVWEPPPKLAKSHFCGDNFADQEDELLEALARVYYPQGADMDEHEAQEKNIRDPAEVLLISGGGSRGSFSAGILDAWWKETKGDIPKFDMITGISTGAIMASWVYLGTPEAMDIMKRSYNGTALTNKNIRSRRWLFPLVSSEYTLNPLFELMKNDVLTDKLIEDVADEYEETKRQLWIGSTNIETGQFCHWNLGERALKASRATGRDRETLMDHYRWLIIASSANPTVFQSVPIRQNALDETEPAYLHADGGVSQMIYVESLETIAKHVLDSRKALKSETIPELNVYAIINGRLVPSQQCLQPGILNLAERSLTLQLKSSLRNDLATIANTVNGEMQGADWTYMTAWIDYRKRMGGAAEFGKDVMGPIFEYGVNFFERDHWCMDRAGPSHDTDDGLCRIPVAGKAHCKD